MPEFWTPPNAEAFVLAWLLPFTGAGALGSERWTAGMVLPYRTVTRVAGPRTENADLPTIRVHTFAETYTEAAREGKNTDDRMMILVNDPSQDIVMADGIANCDWLEISEAAHYEDYASKSVVTRFVSEYRLGLSLSFVAV